MTHDRATSVARSRRPAVDPARRREQTRKARETFARYFEDLVDPERLLPEDERAARVADARSEHFTRLARLAHQSRRTARRRGLARVAAEQASSGGGTCSHTWPGDLDPDDAECLDCGLPYAEWTEAGPVAA